MSGIHAVYENRPLLFNFEKKQKIRIDHWRFMKTFTHLPGIFWDSSNILHPVHIANLHHLNLFHLQLRGRRHGDFLGDWQLTAAVSYFLLYIPKNSHLLILLVTCFCWDLMIFCWLEVLLARGCQWYVFPFLRICASCGWSGKSGVSTIKVLRID